ncbi:hypothetical protein F511_07697 [Dorcoceras hygrometricum]|uniref:Protein BPS1, chloroplastic-like n=1 Tax=Dorcoceras hygrometricum TaxID=472368 RepID=A0A2Z7CRJ1_9LAMI|nr:hypothetical protein F511_07697 [Dorcoceras hygrometricum]
MVLQLQNLGRSLKFSSKLEDHRRNLHALPASLHDFRSKISNFVSQASFLNESGSNPLSLAGLLQCFELIDVTSKALAKLAVEIDYPVSTWGGRAIENYLNFSLNLLHLLNAITSSIACLNEAKISIFHACENPTLSAVQKLKRIPSRNLGLDLKEETGLFVTEEKPFSEKETVVLEALRVTKMIAYWALGLILSGFCCDVESYKEIRRLSGGFEDSLIKGLDLRFSQMVESKCVAKEVQELNDILDRVPEAKRWDQEIKKLETRLQVVDNLVQDIEKQSNSLFSQVLATRNQLLDNFRLTKQNK